MLQGICNGCCVDNIHWRREQFTCYHCLYSNSNNFHFYRATKVTTAQMVYDNYKLATAAYALVIDNNVEQVRLSYWQLYLPAITEHAKKYGWLLLWPCFNACCNFHVLVKLVNYSCQFPLWSRARASVTAQVFSLFVK